LVRPQKFHALFPEADLFRLPGVRQFVRMDEPKEVARLILSTATKEDCSTCPLKMSRPPNDRNYARDRGWMVANPETIQPLLEKSVFS
jgi:hypothetical protein